MIAKKETKISKTRMKLSIIIPIFKAHDYIEKCLDSVICQECEDFNLECILVNDCTPDDSMDLIKCKLKDYVGKIDFVIANHLDNKGPSVSRNTGIQYAKGDFVFFLDSDDQIEVGSLKSMVDVVRKDGARSSDVDVIIGNTFICKDGRPSMSYNKAFPFYLDNSDETALRSLLNRDLYHIVCNKMVKRELILKHNVFFKEGIIDEDMLWSYLVFYYAKGVWVVPQITYIYKDNPGSIMNTSSERIAQRIYSRIIICNMILNCPPRLSFIEYYMYIFYILTRAINLFEINKSDSSVKVFCDDLTKLRDRILTEVYEKRLFSMYLFFLTTKKPLNTLTNFRWFRRYYDKIANSIIMISRFI